MRVHVVIPAHDEAAGIEATIASVWQQTVRPDAVTVVADNCTDATAELARANGAHVFETVGNRHRKAGALNQYLEHQLPLLDVTDIVLVMDADTRLSPQFIEISAGLLQTNSRLGAVGGVFVGGEPSSWLEHAQANEFARYQRDVARHAGRVLVLTGTASAFRVPAMRDVAFARGVSLPGRHGDVYDIAALTEDNEITLALKHLGWGLVSPKQCMVWTELMPTVGDLHRQRLRWYRGAIDNLRSYGLTRITARYWAQQFNLCISVGVLLLLITMTTMGILTGTLRFSLFWSLIGLGFLVERVISSWRTGSRRGRVLSALLFPELVYDLILQFTFIRAARHSARGTTATWHHVTIQMKEHV
ncbi:glycosyltransferase family 2 protein [Angustibacter sp. McL0619]|uniref:glycosyltransferase family 2 protein n=1 Tax=Angustibacter sp. McL0619 TaxID=3415676 RepID=UPI003CE6D249